MHRSARALWLVSKPLLAAQRMMQARGRLEWHRCSMAGNHEVDDLLRGRESLGRDATSTHLGARAGAADRTDERGYVGRQRNLEIGGQRIGQFLLLTPDVLDLGGLELNDVD